MDSAKIINFAKDNKIAIIAAIAVAIVIIIAFVLFAFWMMSSGFSDDFQELVDSVNEKVQ